MPSTGALPPSVEKAYYRKCIELRRRISEVEEHNDATRLRIKRLNRSVLKMRLERAFLLEQLQQRMEYNADGSDRSTSPPPTVSSPRPSKLNIPQDKPLRSKRSHRKNTPTHSISGVAPSSQHGAQSPPPSSSHHGHAHASIQPHPIQPMSSAQSTPDPGRSGIFFAGSPPTTGVNGAASTSRHPPVQSIPSQPNFYEHSPAGGAYDERRSTSAVRENGGSGAEYGRSHAPAQANEMASAGSDARPDANGESRDTQDAEMADAGDGSGAFGGGFTAVNR